MATKAQALKIARALYGSDAFADQARCSLLFGGRAHPKLGVTVCTAADAHGREPRI